MINTGSLKEFIQVELQTPSRRRQSEGIHPTAKPTPGLSDKRLKTIYVSSVRKGLQMNRFRSKRERTNAWLVDYQKYRRPTDLSVPFEGRRILFPKMAGVTNSMSLKDGQAGKRLLTQPCARQIATTIHDQIASLKRRLLPMNSSWRRQRQATEQKQERPYSRQCNAQQTSRRRPQDGEFLTNSNEPVLQLGLKARQIRRAELLRSLKQRSIICPANAS